MWPVAVVLDSAITEQREEELGQIGSHLHRSHLLGVDDWANGMFSHFPQPVKRV